MNQYPFEAVYKHFAGQVMMQGLTSKMFDPQIHFVKYKDGSVVESMPLPELFVGIFFGAPDGKNALGQFLSGVVPKIDNDVDCIVVMSEAYVKYNKKKKDEKFDMDEILKRSLADDPDAGECIMITIYRPGTTRIGMLRINKDRSLVWSDLFPSEGLTGRLRGNNIQQSEKH